MATDCTVEAGRKGINLFSPPGDNESTLKREVGSERLSGKPEELGRSPKAKFRVFGEEMIEKEVKPSGNTGRVYLPLDWVGKSVKIIRID